MKSKKNKDRGKMQCFTHQTAYKDYKETVGKDALDYRTYDRVIRAFFYKLNRAIIVDTYEWKVPHSGGYIRIAKAEYGERKGIFYWKWDTNNPYTRIKKKSLWSFKPVEGWIDRKIGARGLIHHYFKLKNDPAVLDYNVPKIRHK